MRAAVTELELSHFRSHKRARLALDGRPVAIFGPNGAGKTNLIEAVSLLSPGRGMRRAGAEEIARRPERLGWKVRAEVEAEGAPHEIETRAEAGQSRGVRIDDKAVPQVALARVLRVLWLVPSMDRLWIEAAEGRRRFLDRAALSFDPGHAEQVLDYEKAMRERNRLLKDGVRDAHWYGALEGRMAEAGALIATYGLYLLSITEGFNIGQGDTLVLIGAFFWAVHVQVVGYAAKYKLDALKLAILQYLICAGLNLVLALFLEEFSMQATLDASEAILYAGLISVGVAYTLQIVAQKHVDPSRAAILLSLEAVFAVLAGWLMLDELLNSRESWGCILMFAGMMLSQLPGLGKKG